MTALWTTLGTALILVALRDVAHELFHPEKRGSISSTLMRLVWTTTRHLGRWNPRALQNAGPAALVAVASVWTALLAVGWALMYLPQLPGSYHLAPSLPAPSTRGFATALYVSLAALGSVGSSDITPEPGWLRIVTVLETVVGLAMITAWITWVLSIYPVLAERRAFSRTVDVLRRAEPDAQDAIDHTPADALAGLLRGLAADIVKIDARLTQSAVTYYFQEHAPEATLSAQLPYVLALAHEAERCENETVRYHGRMLRLSIERLLRMIDDRFLQTGSRNPDELLTALAKDHLRQT